MQNDLEDLLGRLKSQPTPTLANVEARVWTLIGAQVRTIAPAALWGWRATAAAVVLALGMATHAGATARPAKELALFSARNAMTPSALLGEGR